MKLGRRGFLGALAAAPVAGAAMAEQAKISMLGRSLGGMNAAAGFGSSISAPSTPLKFFDFKSWLARSEKQLRIRAREFNGFDPDILELRLPLTTRMRLQRARNYKRILEEQKTWFEQAIADKGVVEWWA